MSRKAPLTLVILAAGRANRFGRLKQLEPLGSSGETLMEYSLYDALRAGFKKAVLVIQKETQSLFDRTITDRIGQRLQIAYVCQEQDKSRRKPWGTGHAVLSAAPEVPDPFAVINADDYYGPDAFRLIADFLKKKLRTGIPSWCMAGYPLATTLSEEGPVCRAVCQTNDDSRLLSLSEYTDLALRENRTISGAQNGRRFRFDGSEQVSMNCWGFTPDLFPHLQDRFETFKRLAEKDPDQEFFLPDAVNRLIQDNAVQVTVLPCRPVWFGLTYLRDKPQVTAKLKASVRHGFYPEQLWH